MADVFARGGKSEEPTEAEAKELHAKIGKLTVETNFFSARAQEVSWAKKKAVVRRDHPDLSTSQQCKSVKPECVSRWMVAADAWTTSSSNGSGDP
jgi:hypothetical protein